NAFKIGQYLGEYLYVDKNVWGKLLKIRVRLDIKNPLLTGFWVSSIQLPHIWISFNFHRIEKNSMIVVQNPSKEFTLIPSPNILAWPKVAVDQHLDNIENTTPPKNKWGRLTIHGVDTTIMMVHCAVIMCRVAEANEVKGYGWLIIMIDAYFFYLVLKFNVMVWSFGFFQKSNSSARSSITEYSPVAQLKDLLILLMFCAAFL
ncbi:hypothetical protein HAX54_043362, partial [Datura stramonium]|nr:hypothetical protein [Datura stramonium]